MNLALGVAFLAGMGSLGSPCVLPLIPTYLTYLSGVSAAPGEMRRPRAGTTFAHGVLFVVGFSLVFVLFGLSATGIGMLLLRHQLVVRRVAGMIVVVMGFNVTGLVRVPLLQREWQWRPTAAKAPGLSPIRSLVLGISFSAGWTACVGPVLASILALAAETARWQEGAWLLAWYSLGLGVPFLVMAALVARLQPFIVKMGRWLPVIQVISGALLVVLGIMIYLGIFSRLSAAFS